MRGPPAPTILPEMTEDRQAAPVAHRGDHATVKSHSVASSRWTAFRYSATLRFVKIDFPPLRATRNDGNPFSSFGSSWSVQRNTASGPFHNVVNDVGVSKMRGASGNFAPYQRLPLGSCKTCT